MTTLRTEPVRRGLDALARSGLPWDAFAAGAVDLLRRAVPFDASCVGPADPATGLLTGSVKTGMGNERDTEFLQHEYVHDSVNLFLDLVRRPVPVAVLSEDTGGRPELATRYTELFMPTWNLGHEVRVAGVLDGQAWVGFALYRASGVGGFSPAEAEFLASIAPVVARGVRAGLVADAGARLDDDHLVRGPAVLVVGRDDAVVQASAAAQDRIADLGGTTWGQLPSPVAAIVAAARAMATGRSDVVPRLRVRARSGRWLVVHASPLATADGAATQVAVTIEEAGPADVVPLVVAAFGLTGRERDVLAAVVQGASTQEIARQLHLSPYTVQDHLKVIFEKAGVRSRRELIARVVLDQYAPRYGGALGPSGWFVDAPRQAAPV